MKQYLRGSTPYLRTKIYDLNGALVTPTTSIQIHIRDPRGIATQATASMTQEGTTTGVYYYVSWTVPDTTLDGIYTYVIVVTDGTTITKKEGYFEVVSRGTTTT